jgi:hypothetical protein
MFLAKSRKYQPNVGLILIGHLLSSPYGTTGPPSGHFVVALGACTIK